MGSVADGMRRILPLLESADEGQDELGEHQTDEENDYSQKNKFGNLFGFRTVLCEVFVHEAKVNNEKPYQCSQDGRINGTDARIRHVEDESFNCTSRWTWRETTTDSRSTGQHFLAPQ